MFQISHDIGPAFWTLLGVYFVSETLIAQFLRAGHGDRTDDRGSLRLFVTILPLGWFVAFMLAGIPWASFGNAVLYRAGLVVIAAGQLLRWWSIATLGRLFTVNVAIRTEHRLIDSGPYRYSAGSAASNVLISDRLQRPRRVVRMGPYPRGLFRNPIPGHLKIEV